MSQTTLPITPAFHDAAYPLHGQQPADAPQPYGKKITWKDGMAAVRHGIGFNLFIRREAMFKKSLPARDMSRDRNLL